MISEKDISASSKGPHNSGKPTNTNEDDEIFTLKEEIRYLKADNLQIKNEIKNEQNNCKRLEEKIFK